MSELLDHTPSDFENRLVQAHALLLRTGKEPKEIADKLIESLNDHELIGVMVLGQAFVERLDEEEELDELISMVYVPGWRQVFTDGQVVYGPISDADFMKKAFESLIEIAPVDMQDRQTADVWLHDESQASLLSPEELSVLTPRPSPPELKTAKPIEVFDHVDLVSRMSELFWSDEWQDGTPGRYQGLASVLPDLVKAMNDGEILRLARLVDEWLEHTDSSGRSCHEVLTYADIPSPNSMWVSDRTVYAPFTDAASLREKLTLWAKDHIDGNCSTIEEDLGEFIYNAFTQACMDVNIGSVEAVMAYSELDQEESRRLRIASNKILEGLL